ncbi:DUF938 domain-containing protein [Methylobacterium indicum]|uniref:DUF938 domain-containing protein n=1 Tax=Methylobacterium indicum TaxID=1775910 RepID=UPI00243525D7|nr:DUF938 domain-containing protein [Methylobacterium indicum]
MLEWDAVLVQPLSTGDALFAPAVARNREPILNVLHRLLPASGLVLEVASGSGEHIIHFASALPRLRWQPTDADPRALRSIAAHAHDTGLDNVLAPQSLDARAQPWPVARADAVLAINMTHIAPWSATVGLMAGAGGILPEGGLLYLYGPFRVAGAHTAPSNATFDADLRARDPAWGVRDVEAISEAGLAQCLSLVERIPMPANNFSLVYRRGRYRNP